MREARHWYQCALKRTERTSEWKWPAVEAVKNGLRTHYPGRCTADRAADGDRRENAYGCTAAGSLLPESAAPAGDTITSWDCCHLTDAGSRLLMTSIARADRIP